MISVDEVASKLEKLIYHISHAKSLPDVIMLDFDELVGELMLETVKVYKHYETSNKTDEELLLLIKRSVDNRVAELFRKHLYTYRKQGNNPVDINSLIGDDYDDDNMWDVSVKSVTIRAVMYGDEELIESRARVMDVRSRLSTTANLILNEILRGNELISMNVELSVDRAANVYKTNTAKVTLQTWHVADSLGLDIDVVEQAFQEIRDTYAEVCEYEHI